jgi:hypothetical protein
MDFEEIWSTHKKFILTVGIGLIALLIFQGIKTAVYSDDTRRLVANAQKNLRGLRREQVATRQDLKGLREEESTLDTRLQKLEAETEIKPPPRYTLPESNIKSFFTLAVQEARDKVAEVAGIKNVRVPYELGVPSVTPSTREEMARFLLGLSVVERVVTYAVEEGVRRFESIDVKTARGGGFSRETKVVFRLVTRGQTLAALMDRILDPADPLVLTQFLVTHPPRGGGIIATIGLSILEVDRDQPLVEEGVG